MKYYHWLILAVLLPLCIVWAAPPPIGTVTGPPPHNTLNGRSATNAHPMAAVTGLDARFERLSGAIGTGGGVTAHGNLTGRDSANQHPMSAITGLEAAFENLTGSGITQSAADDRYVQLSYTSAGNGRPTADEVAAGYAGKLHALQHYTSNGTDRIPDATAASSGLLKPLWYKILSALGFVVFLDDYTVGDGVTDDTAGIGAAITAAIAANKPIYGNPTKTYATAGGYIIDAPVIIDGQGTTFKLTADAILFDISAQENVRLSKFKVNVPDANTASVIRFTTSYARTVGRGWGPLHDYIVEDIHLYSASSEGWTPTTGAYPGIVTTEGAWTGMELYADTSGGRTGHNYFRFDNIRMDFPYYGFKVVKTGANTAWSAGHHFSNIVIHGFQSAVYCRDVNFNDNTFNHLMLHPLRDDNVVGLDWNGWCNSNNIQLNTFHDSGWNGQTRGEFQAYSFGGAFGNIITGYYEISVGTPPTGTDGNTIIADTWITDKSLWPTDTGYTSNIARIRGPLGIDIEADRTSALHVMKQYTSASTANITAKYDVYGDVPRFVFRHANGTQASPTKTLSSNSIFAIGGRPHTGSAFTTFNTAQVTGAVEEDSDLGLQSGLRFWVTNHGDSSAYPFLALLGPRRMIINDYASTDDGVNTVQVNGSVKATTFTDGTTSKTVTELWNNGGSAAISQASISAGGTVSCDNTIVIITSGAAGADTTLPADCTAGKIITVKNNSGSAQDIIAASGYIDDTPGLEWRIPAAGTTQFISEGTTLGWQSVRHPIPDCDNATTSKLLYDVTTNTYTCGTDQTGSSIIVGDTSVAVTDTSDGYISFTEDNVEAMRLTGEKLGVGTIAPTDKITASLAGTGAVAGINTSAYGTGSGALFKMIADPGLAVDAADRRLGGLLWAGAIDASHSFGYGASIEGFSDGAYSSGSDTPAYLSIKTAPDGGTRSERLRVKSTGVVRFVPVATPASCELGDTYVNSSDNKMYSCTTAGTPGTWTAHW